MAKYMTVICKVKGETILRLNNDFINNNNVFKAVKTDQNEDFVNQKIDNQFGFDFKTQSHEIKQEIDCNRYEDDFEDHLDEDNYEMDYEFNNDINDRNDSNESLESYKKYLLTTKRSGKQLHICQYENCSYETYWTNAIVNHIRTHLGQKPFKCDFPNCGKSFAISCNLNNHKKVHTGRGMASKHIYNETKARKVVTGAPHISATGFRINDSRDISQSNSYDNQMVNHKDIEFSHSSSTIGDNSVNKIAPNKYRMYSNARKMISTIRSQQRRISSLNGNGFTSSPQNRWTTNQRVVEDSIQPSNSVKSIEQYVKITTKNGKMWRICQFPNCGYGTNMAASMVHHIRAHHTNERPFKCHYANCGKAFTIITNLNNHKKCHKRKNI